MIRRLRWWWNRRKPRCGAEPPWRLNAAPCCLPVGHTGAVHADGTGLVWNDQRWAWHGPVLDLADVLADLEAEARARNIDPDEWPKFIEAPPS